MRKQGWETAFGEWCESALNRDFEWGQFDCALMAASCAEAITGTHPEPDLVGSYYTPFGAFRVLHEHDGLSGLCDKHYERVPVNFSQRGDVVLGRIGRKETLMVNIGKAYLIMVDGKPSLFGKKSVETITAWRIE